MMRIIIILVYMVIAVYGQAVYGQPKISIITSVYKGDTFIEGFLRDITRQTIFDQCELILINAASPGNEEPVIREYQNRYDNIVYVRLEQDPGLYAVWNIGIKQARGTYITNANLDDRLAPNCYEVHSAYLDEHPDVDLVYSDKYITMQPNETFEKHTGIQWFSVPQATRESMYECWPCSNPMWRRIVHDRYGFFNEQFRCSGDWEFWLRMLEGDAYLKKLEGYYLIYYSNPVGLSTGGCHAERKQKEDAAIIKRYGYMWYAQGYRTWYTTARSFDAISKECAQAWPMALHYYLKAYTANPRRAEPLVRIAQHYVARNEPALAFFFAYQAEKIPVPESTVELFESDVYEYVRHEIVGQTAWYVQEFDAGEQALKKIIPLYPQHDHLRRNLKFYLQRNAVQ